MPSVNRITKYRQFNSASVRSARFPTLDLVIGTVIIIAIAFSTVYVNRMMFPNVAFFSTELFILTTWCIGTVIVIQHYPIQRSFNRWPVSLCIWFVWVYAVWYLKLKQDGEIRFIASGQSHQFSVSLRPACAQFNITFRDVVVNELALSSVVFENTITVAGKRPLQHQIVPCLAYCGENFIPCAVDFERIDSTVMFFANAVLVSLLSIGFATRYASTTTVTLYVVCWGFAWEILLRYSFLVNIVPEADGVRILLFANGVVHLLLGSMLSN